MTSISSNEMMRVGSSDSACPDSIACPPFVIDDLDADNSSSFASCLTETPGSSYCTTTGLFDGENSLFMGKAGYEAVDHQQSNTFPSVNMVEQNQDDDVETTAWSGIAEMMARTTSTQSNSSVATGGVKASERCQKQIENARRPIACRTIATGPLSQDCMEKHSKVRQLRPLEAGVKRKQAIPKQPYIRPSHPKLNCDKCSEHPEGFRGEHELRRHQERRHTLKRRVWVCTDPQQRPRSAISKDWTPARPLNICKQCVQDKQYNVYYNAAAHLRRAHFFPRKRGRRAKGELGESRAGKAGGNEPSIDWLKGNGYLKEIEVDDETSSVEAASDALNDEDYNDLLECNPPNLPRQEHTGFTNDTSLSHYPSHPNLDYGYPTPADMDSADMQWNAMMMDDLPQAQPMAYTLSAPSVMMSTPIMVNDFDLQDVMFDAPSQFYT